MQHFPNSLELTAASALLLLSTAEEEKKVFEYVSMNDVSAAALCDEVLAHRLNVIAVVARCHEFKLKVVKKARSKVQHIPDCRKIVPIKPAAMSSGSVSTEGSCLSSTSSAASYAARSLYAKRVKTELDMENAASWEPRMKQERVGSGRLRRRADAILNILARGCASEVRIRHFLGDSPDTSKALRMLLRMDEVKRSGAGGRRDPYVYMIKLERLAKTATDAHEKQSLYAHLTV